LTAPSRSSVVELSSRAPKGEATKRYAAIDIGSNSIRQIVADVSGTGTIRVVDEMKAAPRLGAGVDQTGILSEQSMRHALDVLTRMATLAKQLGAVRVDAVATSAVRDAGNRREFLDRVKREAGLRVRLLDGEDEARLSFRSALAHFDLGVGRAVVMDIGGGSIELVLAADGLIDRLISLPYGAIRMTEQFLGHRPRPKDVKRLRRAIRESIRRAIPARDWRGAQVIGSGGTFTNLAGMFLKRQGVEGIPKVHGTKVPREELEHLIDVLQDLSADERAQYPGLTPARADIILGGLAVAAEVMARLEARHVTASAYGIREGLLLESARVEPSAADPGDARERSVRTFAERCRYELPHSQHVRDLSMQLSEAIGPRLGCEPDERQMLADAALLHDVGYHINYENHHKHSYHLILHADLLGIAPDEQVVIANVARYHRGSVPKRKHLNFGSLDQATRRKIRRLAAILRVADGLDRGHVGAVQRVKVRWLDRALRITPVAHPRARALRLELWGADRKSKLLAKLAGRPVEVVAPDGSVVGNE
jgi:exopolyphosphatase / guanosine-5'-triphosphate,3'-diphosphate pyrophosphatase